MRKTDSIVVNRASGGGMSVYPVKRMRSFQGSFWKTLLPNPGKWWGGAGRKKRRFTSDGDLRSWVLAVPLGSPDLADPPLDAN